MKYFIFSLFICLGMVACKHSHDNHSHDSTEASSDVDKSSKEYASAYVCPMHCKGSGSAEPGTCPVCNIAYVVNEDADGHDHDEDDGHDHDDDDGHEH